MDCRATEERLSGYLDESLPAGEMGSVARHLAVCPQCGRAAEELRAVVAALRSEPVPAATPGFWAELYARVEQEGERIPAPRVVPGWLAWLRGRRRLPRLAAAGALAASIVLGAAVRQHSTPEAPRAAAPATQVDDVAELMNQHAEQSAAYPLSDWPRLTFVSTEINAERGGR